MLKETTIPTSEKTRKTYCLCESMFLYTTIATTSKKKLKIDHFFSTKDEGALTYLYVEKEVFKKLSICEEIIRPLLNTYHVNVVRKEFIKLYTLPQDQLETRINQYRLERM